MQTIFRNPLADPFVLGITSGASFGVAIVVLAAGTGVVGVARRPRRRRQARHHGRRVRRGARRHADRPRRVAARVRGTAAILIVGLMIGYLLVAFVSLIVAGADPIRLQQYVGVGVRQLPRRSPTTS